MGLPRTVLRAFSRRYVIALGVDREQTRGGHVDPIDNLQSSCLASRQCGLLDDPLGPDVAAQYGLTPLPVFTLDRDEVHRRGHPAP